MGIAPSGGGFPFAFNCRVAVGSMHLDSDKIAVVRLAPWRWAAVFSRFPTGKIRLQAPLKTEGQAGQAELAVCDFLHANI
jgi:hypothetical protein